MTLVQLWHGLCFEKPCVMGALGPLAACADCLLILEPFKARELILMEVQQALGWERHRAPCQATLTPSRASQPQGSMMPITGSKAGSWLLLRWGFQGH